MKTLLMRALVSVMPEVRVEKGGDALRKKPLTGTGVTLADLAPLPVCIMLTLRGTFR